MNKKRAIEDDITPLVDLADTFMSQCDTGFPKVSGECESLEGNSPDESLSDYGENILKGNLITEQHKDPDISCLFERPADENEVSNNPVCYFVKNGFLMRKFRPPDDSAEDEWAIKY